MMDWKSIAAVVAALGSLGTCGAKFFERYDVEVHVVRVWGADEPLPERLR